MVGMGYLTNMLWRYKRREIEKDVTEKPGEIPSRSPDL